MKQVGVSVVPSLVQGIRAFNKVCGMKEILSRCAAVEMSCGLATAENTQSAFFVLD